MKNRIKRIMSAFLTLVMLITAMPLTGIAAAAALQDKNVGDVIEIGSYPQGKVADDSLIEALDKQSKAWVSYGYYSGEDDYGTMAPGDYMKYADVTYGGAKYRAVTFTKYRPVDTIGEAIEDNSEQSGNGYFVDTVYWFKYEPLKWRVLDPKSGLVMSEMVIDAQAYSNTVYEGSEYYSDAEMTVYANDYAASSLRKWLNEDFYNTAFTAAQQGEITAVQLDNSAAVAKYDSAQTTDKVFLLSYDDVCNAAYGFTDAPRSNSEARRAKATDYAIAQGLWVTEDSSDSYWFLRTPGSDSDEACYVDRGGRSQGTEYVYYTETGVRPAIMYTPKTNTPEKVTGVKAVSSTSTTVKLAWDAVEGVTGYRVYKRHSFEKGYTTYKNTKATSITVSGLTANSTVYFIVRAYNTVDGKSYFSSNSDTLRAYTAPAKVTGIKATTSASAVKLVWTKLANVTGYRVYKYNTSLKKWESCRVVASNTNTCTVSGLSAGTAYKFCVRAYRTNEGRNYYSDISAALTTATRPAAPVIKGVAGAKSVTVSWSKVPGATNYALYMYDAASKTYKYIGRTTALKYTRTGLSSNTYYYFKVRACRVLNDTSYYSAYSNFVKIKTR